MLTGSVLALQLANLPLSLKRLTIWLEHSSINDQRIEPDKFLVEGVDNLSTAVHHLSRYCGAHLTELSLNVNHISPSLFWPSNASITSSIPLWPNLSTMDIRTGFETAAGSYWMRSDSAYPANTHHLKYYFDYEPDSSDSSNTALAKSPVMYFRIRPEPSLFDALAVSIASAISQMPKLAYLNIEFNAHHRGPKTEWSEHFKNYEGWACYFRAGNNARFASPCFRSEWPDPGPDWTNIERPRLEWVFQCPFAEVQWKQPDEADALWRERFPDIDFDLIPLVYQGYKWYDTWERRRDGKVIDRSRRKIK